MAAPEVPQKAPYVITVQPGKYFWCACGKSSNQPYCDGSHKGGEFSPVMEEVTEEKRIAWCGCKNTGNVPFCDGSHKHL